MNHHMGFYGVTTNNLKRINLEIARGSIVGLAGISGGGKSSLAFETIYALCRSEFRAIEGDPDEGENYRVERFQNIVPAIAIRQKSKNINPKSTLFSYFKFQNLLLRDLGKAEDVSLLRLNSYENQCKVCQGARFSFDIDESKVVDRSKTLSQFPFRLFSAVNRDKEAAKLIKFCEFLGISPDKKIGDLTAKQYENIVYGESTKKLTFRFKYGGAYRSRSEYYEGPMLRLRRYLESEKKSEIQLAITFSSSLECKACRGSGIERLRYESVTCAGVDLFSLLTQEVGGLASKIKNTRLKRILDYVCHLGLGHLNLSRSIPSLSGGELQKMRLAKAASTSITGLLYVLDEISSNVYPEDYEVLSGVVEEIRNRGNSILLVDHVSELLKKADVIYSLGPRAGSQGGYIRQLSSMDLPQPKSTKLSPYVMKGEIITSPPIKKNNLRGLSLSFELGSFCCVMGPSGSGKSTFFRQWAEVSKEVLYVTQELPQSNHRSTVSTYLELSEKVAKAFACSVGAPDSYFKYAASNPKLCKVCGGAGDIVMGDAYFGQHRVECQACNGERIVGIETYRLQGLDFYQFSSLPLQDLRTFPGLERLYSVIEMLEKLGLGHLSLKRRTESLSGGEVKRLKLARNLQKRLTERVLVIDEPCAGLDSNSCDIILGYLSSLSRRLRAIVIVEHRREALAYVDYVHLIGPGAGGLGGKLVGTRVVL